MVIGLVGKRLVHYKHSKDQAKRPPILLTRKVVLEKFLQEQRAILIPDTARPVAPPAKSAGLPQIRRAGLKTSVNMNKPTPMRAD